MTEITFWKKIKTNLIFNDRNIGFQWGFICETGCVLISHYLKINCDFLKKSLKFNGILNGFLYIVTLLIPYFDLNDQSKPYYD